MDRSFRIDEKQLQCPSKLLENLSEFLLQSARAMNSKEDTHHGSRSTASWNDRAKIISHHRTEVASMDSSVVHEGDSEEDEQPSGLHGAGLHEFSSSV